MEIPEHRPFKHREGIPSRLHESSRAATKGRIMSVTSADARHCLRAVQRVPHHHYRHPTGPQTSCQPGQPAPRFASEDRLRMTARTIENPVLNSPFQEPRCHFRFDDQGSHQRHRPWSSPPVPTSCPSPQSPAARRATCACGQVGPGVVIALGPSVPRDHRRLPTYRCRWFLTRATSA